MVTILKFYFLLLLICIFPFFLMGQDITDLDFILTNNPPADPQEEDLSFDFNQEAELTLIELNMIRLYQNFVSSQQSPRICTFEPSCSRFGYEAIKKFGPIIGTLLAGDRMERCYPTNAVYYKKIEPNGKCRDELKDYEKYIKN